MIYISKENAIRIMNDIQRGERDSLLVIQYKKLVGFQNKIDSLQRLQIKSKDKIIDEYKGSVN